MAIAASAAFFPILFGIIVYCFCGKMCGRKQDGEEEDKEEAVGDPNFVRSQRSYNRDAESERRNREVEQDPGFIVP